MHAGRTARLARGAAIAAVAVFGASLAHTVGGGTPPGALALVVAAAFALPLGAAMATGRARNLRIVVVAAGSQLALHVCYSLFAGESALGAPVAHAHHPDAAAALAAAASPSPAHAGGHFGGAMLVAHAVAAALTIAALVLADRALDVAPRVLAALRARLAALGALLAAGLRTPHRAVARVAVVRAITPRPRILLRAMLAHRGPPVPVPAA